MEIRAIIGDDGEEYINAKDLVMLIQMEIWYLSTPNISVLSFVRKFIINLVIAERIYP